MIVNLKSRDKYAFLNFFMRWSKLLLTQIRLIRERKKLKKDFYRLKNHFKAYYPKLKKDNVENSLCISCHLCSDICPTKAIEVVRPNLINFPQSLKTGETPKNFYLDIAACTKCNFCAVVCPVDAIELTAKYSSARRVDLVKEGAR